MILFSFHLEAFNFNQSMEYFLFWAFHIALIKLEESAFHNRKNELFANNEAHLISFLTQSSFCLFGGFSSIRQKRRNKAF